jgi:glucose-6-phosphate 1-dehydrogenase
MKKLFIFGSTGDLVKRKVLPALSKTKEVEIIALGRKNLTKKEYLNLTKVKNPSNYSQIKFNKKTINCLECSNFLNKNETNYFYVSLPPKNILPTIHLFKDLKKEGFKLKILIEKPFGNSLKEAKKLRKKIIKGNLENEVFLSDHYLFKENFLNIKKSNYKSVKIVSLEELGIEGRKYYDEVGAIKDMFQGHFMNMLFKILPEENLKKLKIDTTKTSQYREYQSEIKKKSKTETYANVILKNKHSQIELETGKKAKSKESYVKLNDKKISLIDKKNPYEKIFSDFFSGKKENFPTMKNQIDAWKITEKILRKTKKPFF